MFGFGNVLEQAQEGRGFARPGHSIDLQGLAGFELAERLEDRPLLRGGRGGRGRHTVSITDTQHFGWLMHTVSTQKELLIGSMFKQRSINML